MDPMNITERTPWQRAWPWLAALFTVLVQALSFTGYFERLSPFWHLAYLSPLLVLPLCGPLLVVLRPAAWTSAPLRWLRAVLLASAAVWCALSVGAMFTGFRDSMRLGAALKAADRRERGEPAPSRPPRFESLPQLPSLSRGWVFVFWGGFTGIGAVALKRLQDAKEEAARQQLNAGLARDAALRAKLAPHFIFNALNTLHAQIEHDPRAAQATTESLARLFRQVLEVSERATIPLKQELAFVEGYLGIEKARLGQRLRVAIEVPEELELLEVPPLSLQVLVENAVKHGVSRLEAGGLVRVRASLGDRGLVLSVEDPGDGQGAGSGTGTALETLRARLAKPEDLVLAPCEGGFRASFRWRQA